MTTPAPFLTKHRGLLVRITVLVVAVAVLAGGCRVVQWARLTTVTAQFVSSTGLYPGDDVRVVGVKVGTVDSIAPYGTTVTVRMRVPRSLRLPVDVKAVIVAQSLVSARFVQLTPAWTGGPDAGHPVDIPVQRTAVPAEWDEIEHQLNRLTDALAPRPGAPGPAGKLLDSAATALTGNGDRLRATLQQLSDTMATLSAGGNDLFSTIRNLQAFTTALAASNQQIVVFQNRLAAVTDAVADNSTQLSAVLPHLDAAIDNVQTFVTHHRDGLTTQVRQLADATAVLASQRDALETFLHRAPTALANYYNTYNPGQGAIVGVPAPQNFGNPINFICGAVAAVANATADRGAQLCAQYLGPLLNTLRMNYPPVTINPTIGVVGGPGQVVYSPPSLGQLMLPGQHAQ